MACGAPVLTTPRLSLPEVGGDAVAYTEPDADEHRRRAAARCWRRRSAGRPCPTAGLARAKEFTWEASAEAHCSPTNALPSSELASRNDGDPFAGARGDSPRRRTGDAPASADAWHAQAAAAHRGRALPGPPARAGQGVRRAAHRVRHLLPGGDVPRGLRGRLGVRALAWTT